MFGLKKIKNRAFIHESEGGKKGFTLFDFKKIGSFLKKLPRILGEKAFLTFFGLMILSIILGATVFYKYSFLTKKIEPQITERPLKFQEKTYEDVLKIWQEREERFKKADLKEYPNPFK